MVTGSNAPNTRRQRLALWIARRLGVDPVTLATVTAQVDDSAGWHAFQGGPNDRSTGEMHELYADALEAWRKNPMAKRIVDTITDYCLGDGLTPTAGGAVGRFLDRWWNHPKNRLTLRLPELSDELTRAGDLFITLHRNPEDGLSYVRPIPKDRITRIETAANDWETELAYYEAGTGSAEPRRWLSPHHPAAAGADAVMVHYAVNRVVGALMGESDLSTMIPWLLRYSRMLEDRLRLHWATRAFLWLVTVPTNMIESKREQYRVPPDSGTIIVKDQSEEWTAVNPDLKGFDAQFDLRSVRQMIDAGSGLPPHWRGEAYSVSYATARSMDRSAARHLRRRQLYLRHIAVDLAHLAYTRAWELGKQRVKPNRDLISAETTEIDRVDNQELATAARDISLALANMTRQMPGRSATLQRLVLRLIMRFAGSPLEDPEIDAIFQELAADPAQPDPPPDPADGQSPGPRPRDEADKQSAVEEDYLGGIW